MRGYSIITYLNNRWKVYQCNNRDYHTSRHIVVFESDDWGSIRMPGKKGWEELLELGYAVDKRPYERFDTLESVEDIEALFEVLCKYKDCKGNHPIITANMLMSNPDFEKIEKSGFQDYYFEPITKTYERYYGDAKAIELMRQGMDEGVFMPQCHGREHFNVAQWMRGLQEGDEDLLTAFRFGTCGIAPKNHPEQGNKLMKALYAETEEEQNQIDEIVDEGLQMFENLWWFKSKTFVAPCYCWSELTEGVLNKYGVELIQTARAKKAAYQSPIRYYYMGQHNTFNQVYSVRNCSFEPSTKETDTLVESLIKQVEKAFFDHKIAVFSTHRINYVSEIVTQNRSNTLALLDMFLKKLLEKYPNVEFLSSDRIIDVIK